MNDRIWYIKHCRLFQTLTLDQLERLEKHAKLRKYPKNVPVYFPSDAADSVLLLAEGRVKICSNTADGKQAILAFIEPGEVFGELSLVGEGRRDEHAETMAASTVVLLPGGVLEDLLAQSPSLSLGVTKLIGLRRKRVERRLKTLLFRSNRERLLHLLLDLTEQYGKSRPDGTLIDIRLSHLDLASVIGTTRETMTLLLGELRTSGLLKIEKHRLLIPDVGRIAAAVDQAPPEISGSSPPRSDSAPVSRGIRP